MHSVLALNAWRLSPSGSSTTPLSPDCAFAPLITAARWKRKLAKFFAPRSILLRPGKEIWPMPYASALLPSAVSTCSCRRVTRSAGRLSSADDRPRHQRSFGVDAPQALAGSNAVGSESADLIVVHNLHHRGRDLLRNRVTAQGSSPRRASRRSRVIVLTRLLRTHSRLRWRGSASVPQDRCASPSTWPTNQSS
jgi:hypothetical protein